MLLPRTLEDLEAEVGGVSLEVLIRRFRHERAWMISDGKRDTCPYKRERAT